MSFVCLEVFIRFYTRFDGVPLNFEGMPKTLDRLIVTGSGNAKYQADKAAGTLSGDASVYQSTDISFMRIEN